MTLRYRVEHHAIGRKGSFDIDESEFKNISEARQIIIHSTSHEEKISCVIQNYIDFYQYLHKEATRNAFFNENDIERMFYAKTNTSRYILNFISSFGLYVDAFPRHTKTIIGGHDFAASEVAKERARDRLRSAYDASLAYRIVSAMRNHSLHRELPAHAGGFGGSWINSPDSEVLAYDVKFGIDPFQLKRDGKFKPSVLKEIEESGRTDWLQIIHEVVGEIGEIHHWWREECARTYNEARKTISSLVERLRACSDPEIPKENLIVLRIIDNDNDSKTFRMSSDLDKYAEHLRALHGSVRNMAARQTRLHG